MDDNKPPQLQTFAKLFDVAGGQVLVTKTWDAQGHAWAISETVQIPGVELSAVEQFMRRTDRDMAFEAYGQPDAEMYYENYIQKRINEPK